MSPSCLKLLLALTLFVIITECRPKQKLRTRKTKACKDDDDCGQGFSCIQTPKKGKMCAKAKAETVKPSKYKITDYKEVIERSQNQFNWFPHFLNSPKKQTKLTIFFTQDSEFRSSFGIIEKTVICFGNIQSHYREVSENPQNTIT